MAQSKYGEKTNPLNSFLLIARQNPCSPQFRGVEGSPALCANQLKSTLSLTCSYPAPYIHYTHTFTIFASQRYALWTMTAVLSLNDSLKVRFKCQFTRTPALPGYHCKLLSPALAVPAHLSCARCLSHSAMFPASHPQTLPRLISTH